MRRELGSEVGGVKVKCDDRKCEWIQMAHKLVAARQRMMIRVPVSRLKVHFGIWHVLHSVTPISLSILTG